MALFDKLVELGRDLLTTDAELRHIRESLSQIRQEIRDLAADLKDTRERVVRLETARDADRAHLEAEISRFKSEVERAEMRLTQLQLASLPPPLPPGEPK